MAPGRRVFALLIGDSSASPLPSVRAAQRHGCAVRAFATEDAVSTGLVDDLDGALGAGDGVEVLPAGAPIASAVLDRLAGADVAAVAGYSDEVIDDVALLADVLDRPGPSRTGVVVARDKLLLRSVLRRAGLDRTRSASVANVEQARRAVVDVGLPAVVKPVRGSGSRWAAPVTTEDELVTHVRSVWEGQDKAPTAASVLLLETFLRGAPWQVDDRLADHASVEVAMVGGEPHVLGVADRFRPTTRFRETGVVFPSTLAADHRARLADGAVAALRAIGFDRGLAHVEMKFDGDGVSIIEINPRMAGPLQKLTHAVGQGDLVGELMVALALGLDPPTPAEPNGVAAEVIVYPEAERGRVRRIAGLDAVAALDGVASTTVYGPVGSSVDAQDGDLSAVVGLLLHRRCPADLFALRERCLSMIEVELDVDG